MPAAIKNYRWSDCDATKPLWKTRVGIT